MKSLQYSHILNKKAENVHYLPQFIAVNVYCSVLLFTFDYLIGKKYIIIKCLYSYLDNNDMISTPIPIGTEAET